MRRPFRPTRERRGAVSEANGKFHYAHRFSYEIHHGPIPAGNCVMHKCDNPLCVNPAHLRVGTHQDNMQDMKRNGRANAKLTPGHVK